MKFLLVSPFTSVSGSAIRFWNIARRIQERGHSVIYVERRSPDDPPPVVGDVTYFASPKTNNLFFDILTSLLFNIRLLLRNRDADFYYALKPAPNNAIPALIGRILGMRIILDIDDLDFGYYPRGIRHRLSRWWFHAFPRYFDLVTYHTECLHDYIRQHCGVQEERLYYLAQGVSDVFWEFDPFSVPKANKRSLVYCATLGITSDFLDLLPLFVSICREHPDIEITVIGEGVRRADFEQKARECGIAGNMRFIGRIPHAQIPTTLAGHQIGLNYMRNSRTNNCRSVLKIREYCAVGLHVVCNDVGDVRLFSDYVHICPNVEQMKQKILTLFKSEMKTLRGSREFLRDKYYWPTIIESFLRYIENPKCMPSRKERRAKLSQVDRKSVDDCF